MGSNARLGKSQYLVAEADRGDRSFLKPVADSFSCTNIDREHNGLLPQHAGCEEDVLEFMDRVRSMACSGVQRRRYAPAAACPRHRRRTVTYERARIGLSDQLQDSSAAGVRSEGQPLSRFPRQLSEERLGEFTLQVPGSQHSECHGGDCGGCRASTSQWEGNPRWARQFRGVDRRFQLRGRAAGVSVIDDYGHHPTEIKATLAAARQCGFRKVHVVFPAASLQRARAI